MMMRTNETAERSYIGLDEAHASARLEGALIFLKEHHRSGRWWSTFSSRIADVDSAPSGKA
jgi:hypothetical protein